MIDQMLTVDELAEKLNVSPRHVRRLADAGKMPRPVKLGRRVLWNPEAIQVWIAGGCKPVRTVKR